MSDKIPALDQDKIEKALGEATSALRVAQTAIAAIYAELQKAQRPHVVYAGPNGDEIREIDSLIGLLESQGDAREIFRSSDWDRVERGLHLLRSSLLGPLTRKGETPCHSSE